MSTTFTILMADFVFPEVSSAMYIIATVVTSFLDIVLISDVILTVLLSLSVAVGNTSV